MSEENPRLCSSCGKRVAVYRRRTSGEALCKLCLFRSLVKQVRKAINCYKMVNRSKSVLYILRPEAVGESVIGFNIYKNAIKGFDIDLSIMCINGITDCKSVEESLNKYVNNFIIIETNFMPANLAESIKFSESIAIKIARKHNIQFIVTPLFRDELTLLSLIGIITISRTIFSEGLPIKIVDDIKITRPFFYTVSLDISIIKMLDKITLEQKIELKCSNVMESAKKILYASTELMYSSIKSVELLQTYVFGSVTRCKYCGAYSLDSVCDICKGFQSYIDVIYV